MSDQRKCNKIDVYYHQKVNEDYNRLACKNCKCIGGTLSITHIKEPNTVFYTHKTVDGDLFDSVLSSIKNTSFIESSTKSRYS